MPADTNAVDHDVAVSPSLPAAVDLNIKKTSKRVVKELRNLSAEPVRASERAAKEEPGEVVAMTPALALEWWEKFGKNNPQYRNRSRSAETIAAYARDMRSGLWRYTGDAIKFDTDGNLLDGQHRLLACIVAGAENPDLSFNILVIRNLPREAQRAMDQGRIRRLADILALEDHVNTSKLSAAARALLQIKLAAEGMRSAAGALTAYRARRNTHAELYELIRRHPLLAESLPAVERARGLPINLLAAIHYVGKHILKEPERADAFVKVFVTGIQTYPGDPAHTLREFLLRNRTKSSRLLGHVIFYSALRGWNAYISGDVRSKWSTKRDIAVSMAKLNPDSI